MQEQFVTYEVAKLAKEKGFQQEYNRLRGDNYYNYYGELNGDCSELVKAIVRKKDKTEFENINAPTQSLLQKWLRDVHGIHITISYIDDIIKYVYKIENIKDNEIIIDDTPKERSIGDLGYSYEEALETALQNALTLIK